MNIIKRGSKLGIETLITNFKLKICNDWNKKKNDIQVDINEKAI